MRLMSAVECGKASWKKIESNKTNMRWTSEKKKKNWRGTNEKPSKTR